MSRNFAYDALVVGAGPNGLAAAVRLARAGCSVAVFEANATIGGGTRSAELTLPGFVHDVCSAIHPLGLGSPFFRKLSLEKHGLHWIQPEFPLAHPLEGDQAAVLERSVDRTAYRMGPDKESYARLYSPLLTDWEGLAEEFLRPMIHFPRHPIQMARLGLRGFRPASGLARHWFQSGPARALFAGLAAHSFLPLEQRPSAAFGLVLGLLGHSVGWPLPRGGSQHIGDALGAVLRGYGGEIITDNRVEHLDQLPLARATLLDVTPRQFLALARTRLPPSYCRRLEKYRYGPGVFKIDYALSRPIPWRAGECARAGTVHLGGSLEEIAAGERAVAAGEHPERPFVLLAQPSLFDPTRAPENRHTAWAYCHVPNRSTFDMSGRIEQQIERFAPGFRDCVLARRAMNCAELELKNANLVGGDINGGLADLGQLIARPILSLRPYRTALPGVYLCSSSTPTGGGVHGMCGFHAAGAALRDIFRDRKDP